MDGLARLIHEELAMTMLGRQSEPAPPGQRFAVTGDNGAPVRAYRLPHGMHGGQKSVFADILKASRWLKSPSVNVLIGISHV